MPFSCILGEIKIFFYSPWGCFPITSQTLFIYLSLAVMGLRCCMEAFSSFGEWGLLFLVVCRLLIVVASLVAEHGL